ncbi:MAG: 3-hydroxyacyl-CoA dehydrogenase NAD-binding domain-containing protein [Gemmatimonadota bacterium]
MASAFDYVVDERGIADVRFDTPDRRVNVWSRAALDELEDVLVELSARDDLAAIIFRSGKPGTFIAGADVEELAAVRTPEAARAMAQRGQTVFQRVADLSVPTIAAIDGACVGGGLEFVLACSFRLASERDETRLGFPEVQLGIIPAWGGTQRTPRLVGLQQALTLILTSRRISARQAERIGLVDRAVPTPRLLDAAHAMAAAAAKGREVPGGPGRRGIAAFLLDRTPMGRALALAQARRRVRETSGTFYPAPFQAIGAIEIGLRDGLVAGLEAEADAVAELTVTPAARNLMTLYRQGLEAKKPPAVGAAQPVARLGLLGAGVMGGAIAETAAYRGIRVRLKDVDTARVAAGLAHAARIARRLERRGGFSPRQTRQLLGQISGTVQYSGFGRADLVVEAVVEDLELKRRVLAEVERAGGPSAVIATNTSSLRVDALAIGLHRPDRFGGLHFFNPAEKMPLVEVVRGEQTSADTVATLHGFAVALGKTPVIVRDGPGFWVNRLLMPYLNEAVWLYAEGVPVEELDAALEAFGLPVGPLALLDEIGLDVAARVGVVLERAYPDRMKPHPLMQRLAGTGRLGRKSGGGFYRYADGVRAEPDKVLRGELGMDGADEAPVYEDADLIGRCLYPMVNEAARALEEGIVGSPGDGDLALVLGIGWPPFRGGLLRWGDDVGVTAIVERLAEWATALDPRYAPSRALRAVARQGGFYAPPAATPAHSAAPPLAAEIQARLGDDF